MDMRLEKYLKRIFGSEGGFTDDPRDPGNWTGGKCGKGECKGTKFGIASNTYPNLDIRNITIDVAAELYERDYWARVFGPMLPDPVAFQVFDAAVNHGTDRAIKLLQFSAAAPVDGIFGAKTLSAVQSADSRRLAMQFMGNRIEFYTGLKTFKTYGAGWMNRMAHNMAYMAEDSK